MQSPTLKELKDLYDRNVNVMQFLRERESSQGNSLESILASYDLQAGSYVQRMNDPNQAAFVKKFTGAIARILDGYAPASVMEAGVGEATTLAHVVAHMRRPPAHALGFDVSWSRVAVAREYAATCGTSPVLFLGDLAQIPLETDAVEVVYTSYSIEPNRGREKQILAELFRVARRYLILIEPSNELGGEETRRHIEEHQYCRDLYRHACELGFQVIEHRRFEHVFKPYNETALMIIAKRPDAAAYTGTFFGCPACKGALVLHQGNYFCAECLLVYPVVAGVPCLLRPHGIVATRYLEKA
jgi:ubiquinone/menaquinone biosynthesis C-methylase UbiE/uncharacterized protein YbaR (Trm112 family)